MVFKCVCVATLFAVTQTEFTDTFSIFVLITKMYIVHTYFVYTLFAGLSC